MDSGKAVEVPRSSKLTNRLIHATSPYLLQHAHNPVDWYEWGPEALKRARAEDKPILLSIGYAACHWCHVMAHESFEDPEIAGIMNEHFVSVKVDREERPDLDAIYMDATQAMTGQGGWPMTVFLTPEGEPFYAGTYFPREDRHGLPAFPKLLLAIAGTWRERRGEVRDQGRRITAALARTSGLGESHEPLSEEILRTAHTQLERSFDRRWGGFGPAPKFPQPMTLELLLRLHLRGYPDALEMVTTTLDRMAAGGMHDQLGGGFHRYSTDDRWLVPHFERMLYDNAQLARVYLHAWQVTGGEGYRGVVVDTLDYLLREMRHQNGGFYSSQDADSEGEEGRFFVWTWDELIEVAGEEVARHLGASPEGNWEGRNVLWRPVAVEGAGADAGVRVEAFASRLNQARRSLFSRREGRIRPGTDDKILAAWNGLAIVALAEAGRALDEPRYVEAAVAALGFVVGNLTIGGRLHRSWRDGKTSGLGYLDDYSAVALGALAVYETTFDLEAMRHALALADEMVRLFHDPERGGFFQTGSDAEALVIRPKELFDNAVPSGNSLASELLQRLALLTGEAAYEQAGVSALRVAAQLMNRAPSAFGHALGALDLYLSAAKEVAIVGEPSSPDTLALAGEVWARHLPNAVLAVASADDADARRVVPLLEGRTPVDGRAAAYVCQRFACQMPVTDPAELAAQLTT